MISGKKIAVVLPAYNAEKTIEQTYQEIPFHIVDEVILTDDSSNDRTIKEAKRLGIKHIIKHDKNQGYGANQKSCYDKALDLQADIIVMLHPDYQYTPKLIEPICHIIANGVYPVVIGSRILGKGALKGGMPVYKYVSNRFLSTFQNIIINQRLSEYHTGYRAFSREVLEAINYEANSDDFVFDNQMLVQIFYSNFEIGELSCPTKYFDEASSINFKRSMQYGMGVIKTSLQYRLSKMGLIKPAIFQQNKK